MDLPLTFLLLSQGVNMLLNWTLVLIQRAHTKLSFMGVFSVSLAAVDTVLAVIITTIYCLRDLSIFGVRFTSYHICVLVQMMGFVCSVLQWPVFLAAALDQGGFGWAILGPSDSGHTGILGRGRLAIYVFAAIFLWTCGSIYLFVWSTIILEVDDLPHLLLEHCQTWSSRTTVQVATAVLMSLAGLRLCARTYMVVVVEAIAHRDRQSFMQPWQQKVQVRMAAVESALATFTQTWAAFLAVVLAMLFLGLDLPAHLTMNVLWLYFLNSFLISVSLGAHSSQLMPNKISALTDGFCQWNFPLAGVTET